MNFPKPLDCPDGCRVNIDGQIVPVESIADVALLRDEFVVSTLQRAFELHAEIKAARAALLSEFDAFVELSGGDSGVRIGSTGGGTVMSYDGRLKVERTSPNILGFNEKIGFAEELVTQCLRRWSEKSDFAELRTIVELAFKRSAKGNLDRSLLVRLFQIQSEDAEWVQAMEILRESMEVIGRRSYMRFYFRASRAAKWQQVSLDFSKV